MLKSITALSALLAAGSASAQDSEWAYKATIYGWLPAMTTSVETQFGTIESEASGSDVLENLDMAFMGTFAAQRGRLGLTGDLLYTDLSSSQDTPFALYGDATVDLKMTAFSGYALYRVTNSPALNLDLGAGFRSFDMSVDASVSAGFAPAASEGIDGNWTDPLIAARLTIPINEDWFVAGFADWGGSGSSSETYQVYTGVGYDFNETWSTQLGYRYMGINKELRGRDVDIALSGFLLAFSYNF